MQTVIGDYPSYPQAQLAVRGLEAHMSIQSIVIVRGSDPGSAERFLVRMTASADRVSQARALLAAGR